MLNAPNDTGKRIRAYLSILLVPPIPAVVGWEHGVCFGSSLFPIIWIRSSFGPSRCCRDEVLAFCLHGVPAITSGVEAAGWGVLFTSCAEEDATLSRLSDLGLERERVEELPLAPPARGRSGLPLPTPEMLVVDWALCWLLGSWWGI